MLYNNTHGYHARGQGLCDIHVTENQKNIEKLWSPGTAKLVRQYKFSHLIYNRFDSAVPGLPFLDIFGFLLDYKLPISHSPYPLASGGTSISWYLPYVWFITNDSLMTVNLTFVYLGFFVIFLFLYQPSF